MQKLELFEKLEKKFEVNNSFVLWLAMNFIFYVTVFCYWDLVDYHFLGSVLFGSAISL